MDELDRRIRALEAERLRPVPPPRWRPDPRRAAPPERLAELLAEVAAADGRHHAGPADGRREDYLFLVEQGTPEDEAARRVGVTAQTARTYKNAS